MIKAHVDVIVNKHKVHKSPYYSSIDNEEFYLLPNVYNPNYGKISLEMLKILKAIPLKKTDICLDMGCGSGIFSIKLARKCKKIYAVDNYKSSIKSTSINVAKFKLESKIVVLESDLFTCVPKNIKFNFIFANIPFVNEKIAIYSKKGKIEKSFVDFGENIIPKFLTEAPNYLMKDGKIIIAEGNTGNMQLFDRICKKIYNKKILKTIKYEAHKYYIIELSLI